MSFFRQTRMGGSNFTSKRPIAIGSFTANFQLHQINAVEKHRLLCYVGPSHFISTTPSNSIGIFGQHGKQRKQTLCENVATRTQNLHLHFAFCSCLGQIFQLDTWNSIWEWHRQHKMQSRLHRTTQQGRAEQSCSGQLAQLCLRLGPFLVPRSVCNANTSRPIARKYVENGLPNQATNQPQMHQLSNCLPRQRRHNVHQINAGAVTRQATGHGPRLEISVCSQLHSLVCLTGVVCARCVPVG